MKKRTGALLLSLLLGLALLLISWQSLVFAQGDKPTADAPDQAFTDEELEEIKADQVGGWPRAETSGPAITNVAPDAILFFSDFEGSDGGLVGSLDWEWGTYSWAGTCSTQYPPPAAYSGADMWGTVLNECYNNLGNNSGYATCVNDNPADDSVLSFSVDLTGVSAATLSWWEWLDVYMNFDWAEVSVNGTVVFQHCGTGYVIPTNWVQQSVDLTPFVGGVANIEFHMLSSTVVERAGWYIDDLMVSTSATCGTRYTEIEPNDTYTDSMTLDDTCCAEVEANIDPAGDIDWYDVAANGGDLLFAAVRTLDSAGQDSQLRAFAPDGTTELEFDDDDGDAPLGSLGSVIAGLSLPVGSNYLRVNEYGDNGTITPYQLYTSLHDPGTMAYELEANDTYTDANPLTAPALISGHVGVAGDEDWFAIYLEVDQTLFAALDGDPGRPPNSGVDLDLHLYGPDGTTEIWLADDFGGNSATNPPAEGIVYEATADGVYYVLVDDVGDTTVGDYLLSLCVLPAPSYYPPELYLDKMGPPWVVIGTTFDYQIYAWNDSVTPGVGVMLTDTLPAGVAYAAGSASANYGALTEDAGHIYWAGDIISGTPLTITIPVTATADCGDAITNTVVMTHDSLVAQLEDLVVTQIVYAAPLLEEHFESAFPPAGWTVVDNTSDCSWMAGSADGDTNNTGGLGDYADADSDNCGSGTVMDTELWSPMLDLSSSPVATLRFRYDYYHLGNQSASVDISTDGGSNWTTLWVRNADDRGPALAVVNLSDYTGSATTYLRFHFTSDSWNWWWQVDDVMITQPCPAVVIGPSQSDASCPASVVLYNLDVINLGYLTDTLDITLDGVDWPGTAVNPTSMELPAGGSAQITVTVPITAGAIPGDSDLVTVTATAQGSGLADSAMVDTSVALAQAWLSIADTPLGTRYHALAYYDGHLYQMGGEIGWWTFIDTVNAYDIANDAWAPATSMITGAYGMDAVVIDDLIYVPGGNVSTASPNLPGPRLDALQIYDPISDTWSLGNPMPAALAYASAVALDGKIYVMGGIDPNGGITDTLYIYDTGTGVWTQGASMAEARAVAGAAAIGGKIYLAGGWAGGTTMVATLEIYDPGTDSWSYGANLPAADWAPFGDGAKHDRYLIIFNGGPIADGTTWTASNRAAAYDTMTDRWLPLPLLNRPLYGSQGDGDGSTFWMVSGRTNENGWHMALENERLFQCGDCLPPASR